MSVEPSGTVVRDLVWEEEEEVRSIVVRAVGEMLWRGRHQMRSCSRRSRQ